MTHITFVKKVLADGSLCKKCLEVAERLELDGLISVIDHIVIADERDPQSPGTKLARTHSVQRAPFFLIEDQHGDVTVYDIYFKFKKYLATQGIGNTNTAVL